MTAEGKLLSHETVLLAEVLVVRNAKTIVNRRHRRAGELRPGSENLSKADRGNTGTQASLPSPNETRFFFRD